LVSVRRKHCATAGEKQLACPSVQPGENLPMLLVVNEVTGARFSHERGLSIEIAHSLSRPAAIQADFLKYCPATNGQI
jgi:hypothetical protein